MDVDGANRVQPKEVRVHDRLRQGPEEIVQQPCERLVTNARYVGGTNVAGSRAFQGVGDLDFQGSF